MDQETLNNIEQVNRIGEEPNIGRNIADKRKKARTRYYNWLMGMIISMLPLFAVPSIWLFKGESNFCHIFYEIFCDYEVVFVGVSLAITSLNDRISNKSEDSIGFWTWPSIILIVSGALIYGVLTVLNTFNQGFDSSILFFFNLAYLGIILVFGTIEYLW